MLSAVKLGRRLTMVVIFGLMAIASFFIINSYQTSKSELEESVLSRLQAIANTTAIQIDGDVHELIISIYQGEDDLKTPLEDDLTRSLFNTLKLVKEKNNLKTDIYTLFIEEENQKQMVYMGMISGDVQYFRHVYFSHPKELLLHFDTGYTLPSYEDEHGVWLSAFSPIKNSKGETVAVIQVDEDFNVFLANLEEIVIKNIIISLLIISLVAAVMIYLISRIVKVDKQKTQKLEHAYKIMKTQNKKISDSINYAVRIQDAIVAKESDLRRYFPDSFMFYNPKDVVSGDFPWMIEREGVVYIAVVDCTGHGVPGAMLSFIGHFLLNEINSHIENLSPNQILDKLHEGVVKTLKQEEGGSAHDGMDIALCKIDVNRNVLEYSGAHRPLFFARNGELKEVKGTRKSIGGTQYNKKNRVFENNVIPLEKDDAFYFYSDGLVDQMGDGELKNTKLGSRKIRELLSQSNHKDVNKVGDELVGTFHDWMGDSNQLDDVLLIGIKI